ncbi:MAG: iron chelate uptake ABC transporter family permease subunit [bacterium]
MDALTALLSDFTVRTVMLGCALLGFTAGALGVFALLRRQSLLGDAISHAALPGVAIAFLLSGSRDPLVLVLGALASGWLGTLLVSAITRSTRLREDSALGIVLSVFFGVGLVILVIVNRLPTAGKAGLSTFLFGNASTMLTRDVWTICLLGLACLCCLALFWKEFKLISFDPQFAASTGLPERMLDTTLTTLIVLAIVIGLQAVGVVLMSALVVAPAAAARQFSDKLLNVVLLGGLFGALSGIGGAMLSASVEKLPTGPVIVVLASVLTLLAILLAPHRGLLPDWLRHLASRRRIETRRILQALYRLVESDPDPFRPHDPNALHAVGLKTARSTLAVMVDLGWVEYSGERGWVRLTAEGWEEARRSIGGELPA